MFCDMIDQIIEYNIIVALARVCSAGTHMKEISIGRVITTEQAGNLPPDLKRGVLSEDGIWNLLSDYCELQKKKQK